MFLASLFGGGPFGGGEGDTGGGSGEGDCELPPVRGLRLSSRLTRFLGRYLNVIRMECRLNAIGINVGVRGNRYERDIVEIVDVVCKFDSSRV